jgi:hypothetical protein
MKRILLILTALTLTAYLCLNARAESLCDLQIVMQDFEARYGKPLEDLDASRLVYNQQTFTVSVVYDPSQGRPWATDIDFVAKRTPFTKVQVQDILRIISALPGTYSKEISSTSRDEVTQIHFQLESYTSKASGNVP